VRPPSRRLPGIGSHHSAHGGTDDWLTPPGLLARLGVFDLDPCSPLTRPWDTAAAHLTLDDDGLHSPWTGRVWMNPPYSEVEAWMDRMAEHGHGTALVFARTDTRWWHRAVWPFACSILFLAGRVSFCRPGGDAAGHNSGGPSALVAYGEVDGALLAGSGLPGALVPRARLIT
jgi:hypothetical protein